MKIIVALVCVLALSLSGFAITNHNVNLTWTDSADKAANPSLTYKVYRTTVADQASCTTTASGFTQIATDIATNSYANTNVPLGKYCYVVTSFLNGQESVRSNAFYMDVPAGTPDPPTGLSGTVQ